MFPKSLGRKEDTYWRDWLGCHVTESSNQGLRLDFKDVVEKREKGVKTGQRCDMLINGYVKRQKGKRS